MSKAQQMSTMYGWCSCSKPLPLKQGLLMVTDELVELAQNPSLDELSDVIFCVNRFFANRLKKDYIKLIPGDGRYLSKARARLADTGCIRSANHFTDCRLSIDESLTLKSLSQEKQS